MTNSPNPPRTPKFDPNIIEKAALTTEPSDDGARFDELWKVYSELLVTSEAIKAENTQLKGKKTVDDVKAEMMKPYADKVFTFVVWYCIVVAIIVITAGFCPNFKLSEMILSIISGSTAVSVIGLIGIVVSGLFGVSRSSAKARRGKP